MNEKEVKKLWGLSAGRCAFPGCGAECIKFLNGSDPTILGEMAHIVAKMPNGPRGEEKGGDDKYENLVLLCPTHHTEIDKSPKGTYTVEAILAWKAEHEQRIRASLDSPKYDNKLNLGLAIARLLLENRAIWKQYGPESEEAKSNLISSAAEIWKLKKLETIVPNNRKIISSIDHNKDLIELEDYEVFMSFVTHAEGFESSCYERKEGVPRFPTNFEEVVMAYAKAK